MTQKLTPELQKIVDLSEQIIAKCHERVDPGELLRFAKERLAALKAERKSPFIDLPKK